MKLDVKIIDRHGDSVDESILSATYGTIVTEEPKISFGLNEFDINGWPTLQLKLQRAIP